MVGTYFNWITSFVKRARWEKNVVSSSNWDSNHSAELRIWMGNNFNHGKQNIILSTLVPFIWFFLRDGIQGHRNRKITNKDIFQKTSIRSGMELCLSEFPFCCDFKMKGSTSEDLITSLLYSQFFCKQIRTDQINSTSSHWRNFSL